jgi:hypothetical protein
MVSDRIYVVKLEKGLDRAEGLVYYTLAFVVLSEMR